MQILRTGPPDDDIIALSADIGPADVATLRLALVDAVDVTSTDLLVDAREVTAFDAACLPALTAARSRAKFLRRSIVVLDTEGGPVEAELRRSGHLTRLSVHPDPIAARTALAARRAVRARLNLVRVDLDRGDTDRRTVPAAEAVHQPIAATAAASVVPDVPSLANPRRRVVA
jgi:hypothetical protein